MVYWLIVLKDQSPTHERRPDIELVIYHISKKINSYLWTKKTVENFYFVKTFNLILELLSFRYLMEDPFSYENLVQLLNLMGQSIPYR